MDANAVTQLIISFESMKLRMQALEEALLKVKGFYREEGDGSTKGQIKFSVDEPQAPMVEPATTTETPVA